MWVRSEGQLIAFRFLAGPAGSGSASLSVSDMPDFDLPIPEERGATIAIYSPAPLLGPVKLPDTEGWMAERSTWRWPVFWATSLLSSVADTGYEVMQHTDLSYWSNRPRKCVRSSKQKVEVPLSRISNLKPEV